MNSHPRSTIKLKSAFTALLVSGPLLAQALVPPRFYWKSLAGANAVPVISQNLNGNANPLDPAHLVTGNAAVEANINVVGFAKMFPVFDRTVTVALLEPMGRISGDVTVGPSTVFENASGYGDPMLEVGMNIVGPRAIKNIPELLRYEPKFSLDVILDVAAPLGEYDSEQALNLGQNRWYGRVGAPIVWQIGAWVPGRRTTFELLPSVWMFTDNTNYVNGQRLETEPMFQWEAHLTRDWTENFWGSLDGTQMTGGKSRINGVAGESLDNLGVGLTLGYQLTDNLSLTTAYMSTINDGRSSDLKMDGVTLSLTYGWHRVVEGQKRLHSGH
jgi:hypothetical protein